jgi:small GTP-binding protein
VEALNLNAITMGRLSAVANINTPLVKIIVAGASQVGKTSLVHKYVFKKFIDVSPTIGVNFAQKIGFGRAGPLNLSIWDLSGEERFRFLMPQFCSGATGMILVFDQTKSNTIAEGASWLTLVKRFAHPSHRQAIILAGNKTDLFAEVSYQDIKRFCKKHGIASFIGCSAKTGKNVDVLFETLCSIIQSNHSDLARSQPHYLHGR